MKGFPNQVADLETLTKALRVLLDLKTKGQHPRDDGIFGEALIRSRVLGTGHTPIPVDDYLDKQRNKAISDQSFRTRARGLRELFRILGLIENSGLEVEVTQTGRQISSLSEKGVTYDLVRSWRPVIVNMMHDGGDGESSHPYQVLLRLVARCPGITRAKCALALEAKNDSEKELDRIVRLADLDENKIMDKTGITMSTWNNAKKILPRFAEQLGDVQKEGGRFFLCDVPGVPKESPIEAETGKPTSAPRTPRSASAVTASTIAKAGTTEEWDESKEFTEIEVDPETLKAQKAKIKKRLKRHNIIVQRLAKKLEAEGAELFENPFDCLACFPDEGLLVEVKSLDGTEQDEKSRVRAALAQLLYYESFVTRPLIKKRAVRKIACFEKKISDAHIDWLQASDIFVIWGTEGGFDGTTKAKRELSGHIGF